MSRTCLLYTSFISSRYNIYNPWLENTAVRAEGMRVRDVPLCYKYRATGREKQQLCLTPLFIGMPPEHNLKSKFTYLKTLTNNHLILLYNIATNLYRNRNYYLNEMLCLLIHPVSNICLLYTSRCV